jgi:CIC family chloride channel protein
MEEGRGVEPSGRRPANRPRWARHVVALLDRWQPPEAVILVITALLVGLGGGLGAVIFRWLIDRVRWLGFEVLPDLLPFMGRYAVVLVPAIGGLFVGPLIYFFAREAKGHGVPEVMEAVALRGGRIRPIVAVIKSLASSISIGSGGSVGREGPIVQIGSALGSSLGQWLHFSDERIRNLVACGAAAGVAATFNAPIAGVIFALEVILGEFTVGYFSTVVISSVTASVIGRIFFGDVPAFIVPQYSLTSPWALFLYLALGLLAGVVGVAFIRLLYWFEDVFDAWRFPEYLKPAVGGLIVGGLLVYFPQVGGVGYGAMESALRGELALGLLGLLVVLKVLATSATIGSGGSGGVFAPSLFVGAMLGGAFGMVVHNWLPQITSTSGAYAMVGMAAVFAGASRAPITAVLILFEMTDDYRIILPLMLATGVSTLLADYLFKESIYTLKLTRRGIRLERGRDIDVMQGVLVGEAMTTNPDTVDADLSLEELDHAFVATHHHGFPVLDRDGKLFGMVTIQDLERVRERGPLEGLRVRDIATTSVLTAFPDEPVWQALKRLGTRDVGRLPVVSRNNPRQLVGVVRRHDIIRAYQRAILRRMEMQQRRERLWLGKIGGTEFVELEVAAQSPLAGRAIQDLILPHDCVIVSVRRGRRVIIPHGDTVFDVGDRVTALVSLECKEPVCALFLEAARQ